jgi:TPR repeat protein
MSLSSVLRATRASAARARCSPASALSVAPFRPTLLRPAASALHVRALSTPTSSLEEPPEDAKFAEGLRLLESGRLAAAIDAFAEAASRGDAAGNYFLGLAYDGLLGVDAAGELPLEKDSGAAVRCYKRAAEGGHAEAMLNLSLSLKTGDGVPTPDIAAAFRWLSTSAEAGCERAQYNAAVALDPLHPPYGTPGASTPEAAMIPKAAEAAVSLYRQAADQGHAKAMVNLGIALYSGVGTEKDAAAAKALWEEAAELGVPQAETCLRNMEEAPGKFENMFHS